MTKTKIRKPPPDSYELTPLQQVVAHVGRFSEQDARLIRDTCCAEANLSLDELARFLLVCKSRRLDPLQNQIYAIRRKGKVTHQTGIDGFRAIAARSGQHLSTAEPEFAFDKGGNLVSASVTVCKLTQGQCGTFTGIAFMEEYCPASERSQKQWHMWRRRPRGQLAKCAESVALRQAFPEDLGGLYTGVELQKADSEDAEHVESRQVEAPALVGEAMPGADDADWSVE